MREAVGDLDLGVQGVVRWIPPKVPKVTQLLDQMAGLAASVMCALGLRVGGKEPAEFGVVLSALEERMRASAWEAKQRQRWGDMQIAALL